MPQYRTREPGIRIEKDGRITVTLRVTPFPLEKKVFPKGTPVDDARRWRLERKQTLTFMRKRDRGLPGSLREDVQKFLGTLTGRKKEDREDHFVPWVGPLGHRALRSLTTEEIAEIFQGLPGAASTRNHYLSALSQLWVWKFGKAVPNPVRGVTRAREPRPEPRGRPLDDVQKILEQLRPSPTKSRLTVLAYTGLRLGELMRVRAEDLLEGDLLFVRTGKGGPSRTLPLLPPAKEALVNLVQQKRLGAFSRSSLRKALRAAQQRAMDQQVIESGRLLRPHDLRHSFGTAVYQASRDIRATQLVMGHSSLSLTTRYTLSAAPAAVQDAVGKLLPEVTHGHEGSS